MSVWLNLCHPKRDELENLFDADRIPAARKPVEMDKDTGRGPVFCIKGIVYAQDCG